MNRDGLGFPEWLGGLITAAGSAIAGGVASRIADGGQSEQVRQQVERSLTFEWEMRRMEAAQRQQMYTMAGLGLGAVLLLTVLK